MPGKIFLATPGGSSYAYTPADVAGSTGPLTVLGGTLTGASTPVLNLTQTWNNAATTFTGLLFNATDTASNASSLLEDLQVGGTSKFKIDKTGLITTGVASGSLAFSTSPGTGFYIQGANFGYQSGGNKIWLSAANQFTLVAAARLSWVASTDPNGTEDTLLYRDAAGILALRNGTTAQALRVYNTFTDASNFERLNILWSSNICQIYCDKAGTGTTRSIVIGGQFAGDSLLELNPTGGNGIRVGKGGIYQWQFVSAGNFIPVADSTYNIGANGNSVLQLFLSKTITAAGTTGAQTINKSTGSVNFAAAATSLVVTNSLVTTSSDILAQLATNDTTAILGAVVAAAGSFTIFMKTAPTAETRVNFFITN